MLYDVIAKLHFYQFNVDFILMDVGQENRSFIKSHFSGSPYDHKYITSDVTNPTQLIALCQDVKHNTKKFRNGLTNSGDGDKCARNIILDGKFIQWKMWIDAVKWDQKTNTRLSCHKIRKATCIQASLRRCGTTWQKRC